MSLDILITPCDEEWALYVAIADLHIAPQELGLDMTDPQNLKWLMDMHHRRQLMVKDTMKVPTKTKGQQITYRDMDVIL